MKKIILPTACALAIILGSALAQEKVKEVPLIHPDEIVTEEEFDAQYINFLQLPENIDAAPAVDGSELRFQTDLELIEGTAGDLGIDAMHISALDAAISDCIDLRTAMEQRIGPRPGAWTVRKEWVATYQNCLLQRKADLRVLGAALQNRYAAVVQSGGDEGATTLTDLIDRMRVRHSEIRQHLNTELEIQKDFVAFYNSGVRNY